MERPGADARRASRAPARSRPPRGRNRPGGARRPLPARGPGASVGEALQDQRLVAGIGNMWMSEALWAAALAVASLLGEVTRRRAASRPSGGRGRPCAPRSRAPDGRGVYRRAGRPCPRCGTPIESRGQGDDNRTAYWCPPASRRVTAEPAVSGADGAGTCRDDRDSLALPSRYHGSELIATGGMADVYAATDEMLGRRVAIKVLGERFARDPDLRARFTREARIAARLSNEPNVVTIFDVADAERAPGDHDGVPARRTVADRMRGGRVSPALALAWLADAGRALDAAHAHGVIHRDVKPANLMLAADGDVRVTDFGIARIAGDVSLTSAGTILGTSGYMSPEQAVGGKRRPRATATGSRWWRSSCSPAAGRTSRRRSRARPRHTRPRRSRRRRLRPDAAAGVDDVFERGWRRRPTTASAPAASSSRACRAPSRPLPRRRCGCFLPPRPSRRALLAAAAAASAPPLASRPSPCTGDRGAGTRSCSQRSSPSSCSAARRRDGDEGRGQPVEAVTVLRTATVSGTPQVRTVTVQSGSRRRRRPRPRQPRRAVLERRLPQRPRLPAPAGRERRRRAPAPGAGGDEAGGHRLACRGVRARTTSLGPLRDRQLRGRQGPARALEEDPGEAEGDRPAPSRGRQGLQEGALAARTGQDSGPAARIRSRGRPRSTSPARASQLRARGVRLPSPRARGWGGAAGRVRRARASRRAGVVRVPAARSLVRGGARDAAARARRRGHRARGVVAGAGRGDLRAGARRRQAVGGGGPLQDGAPRPARLDRGGVRRLRLGRRLLRSRLCRARALALRRTAYVRSGGAARRHLGVDAGRARPGPAHACGRRRRAGAPLARGRARSRRRTSGARPTATASSSCARRSRAPKIRRTLLPRSPTR